MAGMIFLVAHFRWTSLNPGMFFWSHICRGEEYCLALPKTCHGSTEIHEVLGARVVNMNVNNSNLSC